MCFFDSSYSHYKWSQIKSKLRMTNTNIMDLNQIITDINSHFRIKSLERDLAHVLLTTAVYHLCKERNNRTHNKTKLSKEQRWTIIEKDSKIILQKSKKKIRNQTRFDFLADYWSKEAGSKHVEHYLHNPKVYQTDSSIRQRINRVNYEPLTNNYTEEGEGNCKSTDLGCVNTRSVDLSHAKHNLDLRNHISSNNADSNMRSKFNQCLSYWERGESSKNEKKR